MEPITENETLVMRRQIMADITGLEWIIRNTTERTKPSEMLEHILRHKRNMAAMEAFGEKIKR